MIIQFTDAEGKELAVFSNADKDEIMNYIDDSNVEGLLMNVLDMEGVDPDYRWLYLLSAGNRSSLRQRAQLLFYESQYGKDYTVAAFGYLISQLKETEEIDLDDYTFEVGAAKTMSEAHRLLSEQIVDEYYSADDDLMQYFDYESHGSDNKTWGIEYNGRYYAISDRS